MKKAILIFFCSMMLLAITHGVLAINATSISLPNPLCPQNNPGQPGCVQDFTGLIAIITGYVVTVIGAVATLMLIWGAILFVTSGGNEARITKAKKVLIYAVVGIAIALAASGLIIAI